MRSRSYNHSSPNTARGFTLVELVVVTGIIGLLALIVIVQYRRFDSQLLIRNVAYEIALAVREAQSLGIGVRGANGTFNEPYGIHFTEGDTYILFRDSGNTDNRYDAADQKLTTYKLGRGNEVTDLCVGTAPLSGSECGKSSLDIMFRRPDPDAIFYPAGSAAQVTVTTPSGALSRMIAVTATGQVSVE